MSRSAYTCPCGAVLAWVRNGAPKPLADVLRVTVVEAGTRITISTCPVCGARGAWRHHADTAADEEANEAA